MTTLIVHHPDIALHDRHASHGIMADNRIDSVANAVLGVQGVTARLARPATILQLGRYHTQAYLDNLQRNAPTQPGQTHCFDDETQMNSHTWRALQLSAGAACDAVDAVMREEAVNAFCPVYAGHHAGPDSAEGFCIINTVAVAMHYAIAAGIKRLAVLDIDTHSGNGTIAAVRRYDPGDPDCVPGAGTDVSVLFAETYQNGYPGNFLVGRKPANVFRERVGARYQFFVAWEGELLPTIRTFAPEMILVSAGFDTHMADPLGDVRLLDCDYPRIAQAILAVCPRVVAVLEGGYDIDATSRCAALFVESMVEAAKRMVLVPPDTALLC